MKPIQTKYALILTTEIVSGPCNLHNFIFCHVHDAVNATDENVQFLKNAVNKIFPQATTDLTQHLN